VRTVTAVGLMMVVCLLAPAERRSGAPAGTDEDLQRWWDDLEKPDPASARALLGFASHPDKAVAFFKKQLVPLALSELQAAALIEDLGSEDEAVWRPAFEKLEYLDPRLAIGLEKLMDGVVNPPVARTRLVEVLCDAPPDSYRGKDVRLRSVGPGEGHNFTADNGSWWAEASVARLCTGEIAPKKKWTRAVRAIVVLEHIHSPEAIALLKELAGGHPDAAPTRAAQEALERVE